MTRTTSFTSFAAYLFWHDLVWVSLGWSVLNLLPLLPLDGGNVARASLRRAMGERGDVMALWLSTAIASVGAVWALVVERQPFLAMYGVFFAGYSVEQLIERRDAPFRDELAAAARQLSDDPEAAAATAKRVLAAARGRAMLTEAGEIAAWAALARDDAREALEMIRQMGSTARPTSALQGCAALVTGERDRGLRLLSAAMVERPTVYLGPIAMRCIVGASAVDELASALLGRRGEEGPNAAATLALGMHLIGRYEAAISVAEGVYADGRARRATVAYNAACSAARSGSADRAIRWLEAAIGNGFDKAEMLDEDDDLDSLRGMPEFKRLMTSAPSTPPTR